MLFRSQGTSPRHKAPPAPPPPRGEAPHTTLPKRPPGCSRHCLSLSHHFPDGLEISQPPSTAPGGAYSSLWTSDSLQTADERPPELRRVQTAPAGLRDSAGMRAAAKFKALKGSVWSRCQPHLSGSVSAARVSSLTFLRTATRAAGRRSHLGDGLT